jgi:hypothetical protein
LTALVIFVALALGLIADAEGGDVWIAVAFLIGFFAGGFFADARGCRA